MWLLPVLALAAAPATAPDMAGVWELEAGDTAIFLLDIEASKDGPTATWERPTYFQTDGESFSRVRGPAIRREARSIRATDGDLEITFDDPHGAPDVFRLHRIDPDHIRLTYEGTPFEPFDLTRAAPRPPRSGPWDEGRTYVRHIDRPTSAEMTAIFDADQADRRSPGVDWSMVGPADDKRRARTQDLLDADQLHSGDDFYHAAFVFQHGDKPEDYLKAHLLAMVAVARGKPEAVWIASASLDRYLGAIGQPQVLGTQYHLPKDGPVTQEPYDRSLLSDAMRRALHVPSLEQQDEQRQRYEAARSKVRKDGKAQ